MVGIGLGSMYGNEPVAKLPLLRLTAIQAHESLAK